MIKARGNHDAQRRQRFKHQTQKCNCHHRSKDIQLKEKQEGAPKGRISPQTHLGRDLQGLGPVSLVQEQTSSSASIHRDRSEADAQDEI